MTLSYSKHQIGSIVKCTLEGKEPNPRENRERELIDWPAILYKWVIFDNNKEVYIAGLYVFTDDGLKQLRNVPYSVERKAETWR